MTDYGRPLSFGIFPPPDADSLDAIWEAVHIADQEGLDLVGIQDHPYQRRFVDTLALLTAIAVRTEQISVFPDVASLPLRPPAALAKTAASIDLLSGGRFELGLGKGRSRPAQGSLRCRFERRRERSEFEEVPWLT